MIDKSALLSWWVKKRVWKVLGGTAFGLLDLTVNTVRRAGRLSFGNLKSWRAARGGSSGVRERRRWTEAYREVCNWLCRVRSKALRF